MVLPLDDDFLALLTDEETSSWCPRVVSATILSANSDVATVRFVDTDNTTRSGRLPVTEYASSKKWQVDEELILLQCDNSARPIMSNTDERLVTALLDGLSPEVRTGKVRVMAVARRPGQRVKIAVASTVEGIDPVAACVGRAHNRVDAVREGLGGEQVDIVPWHPDAEQFLKNAIQPAKATHVFFDQKSSVALVVCPDHQMSAAVGGGGLNSALAGELLGRPVRVVKESSATRFLKSPESSNKE